MVMSFTTLMGDKNTEGAIKYYVRHSEVPSASILESAQGYIYSKLRTRQMKVLIAGATIGSRDRTLVATYWEWAASRLLVPGRAMPIWRGFQTVCTPQTFLKVLQGL